MSTPRSKALMDALMATIVEKGPGYNFPSQEDMCYQYGCSRPMVREAISVLAYLNVVNVAPKWGTTINPVEAWRTVVMPVIVARSEIQKRKRAAAKKRDAEALAATTGAMVETLAAPENLVNREVDRSFGERIVRKAK